MNYNTPVTNNSAVRNFEKISYYISTYTFIFYVIFGNIGNLFKICFFLQKPLKRCPCTTYILFATISHFFTLNNIPLFNLLSKNWMIITFGTKSFMTNETLTENLFMYSNYSIKMCRIRNYFHMWSSNTSFQILVFASINRYYTTIKHQNRSQTSRLIKLFSSLSAAYVFSIMTYIIWALISISHFYNITMQDNICAPRNTILWAIGFTILHTCQSISMVIFGTLTILRRKERVIWIHRRCRNHHEMIPMFNQLCQYCRNQKSERYHIETQLTSMIITEIILVLLTLLPYTMYIVYRLITIQIQRNSIELAYENLIERLIQLTLFFEPSCGFYIYLYSLTTLKIRFFNILQRKIGIL